MTDKTPVELALEADGWRRVPRADKDYLSDIVPPGIGHACFRRDSVRVLIAFHAEVIFNEHKFGVYWYDASVNTWVLAALVVDKANRHKGHASRALESIVTIAFNHGAKRVQLEPVEMKHRKFAGGTLKSNELVLFYARHGFVPKDSQGKVMERTNG